MWRNNVLETIEAYTKKTNKQNTQPHKEDALIDTKKKRKTQQMRGMKAQGKQKQTNK